MNTEKKKLNLIVTPGPHIKGRSHISEEMRDVGIALIPAVLVAIYFFRLSAVLLILVGVISAILFERICLKFRKMTPRKEDFGSAGVTGLLLVFTISPILPWWMIIVGNFIAIVVAKHFFGGLGYNIFNPALIGRAFLMASWPLAMTTWAKPTTLVTTATILSKTDPAQATYLQMFIGNTGGSLGETSALALLIGAAYLFWKQTIDWRIPLSYLGTVIIFAFIFRVDPMFHLLAGGLMLGAFYMATDPVTSPVSKIGRWIFGFGCGLITMIIRLWGGYPEGVCYSILLMNAVTPLLDRYTQGKVFGK